MYHCHICDAQAEHADHWVRIRFAMEGEPMWVCPACYASMQSARRVARCEVCGGLFSYPGAGSVYGQGSLCDRCASDGYTFCDSCGCLTDDPDESGLCPECSSDGSEGYQDEEDYFEDRDCIHEYHYTPPLSFHSDQDENLNFNPYMGFELEVDSPDGMCLDVNRIAAEVASQDVCWCKHDGSLHRGFEMVSHPMTLLKHKQMSWPWKLRHMISGGVRSYECRSCSMHVHVNRDFLRRGQWNKLDDWLSENMEFAIKIAQRHSTEYAKFHSDMGPGTKESVRAGSYRYAAVNFENDKTIEFRIFRGTLRAYIVFKNLEFVDALVRFFKFERERTLENFIKFCRAQPARYAELLAFFKEKQIN